MRWVLLALLAAGLAHTEPRRLELLQELVHVEAMERRTLLVFPLQQQGALLEVKFVSKREGEGVRMSVYADGSNVAMAGTPYELSDEMHVPLVSGREYRIEIENLRQRLGSALVDVEVTLLFGAKMEAQPESVAKPLDPRRKFYTIAVSLALFALILGYSAIHLGPPLLDRWRADR